MVGLEIIRGAEYPEELVSLVRKKTGSPKETVQNVVKIVIDFLKKKLPLQWEQPLMVS